MAASAQGAISEGFKTNDPNLAVASLVVLQTNSQSTVQAATSDKSSQLLGIVAERPLVALGDDTSQAQIVTNGLTPALVSDVNGAIRVGDKITASPIEGVGMKALSSTQVVGTAESVLNTSGATTRSLTDKSGHKQTVHIGTVLVQVNVSYYATTQDRLSSLVPTFLLNFGSTIAGKDVSPLRVLIGFLCLIIGFVIAAIVLQAAVRSGIISIGRNPLAHSALRQSLIDVLVTCVGLLLVTIILFYLILTL